MDNKLVLHGGPAVTINSTRSHFEVVKLSNRLDQAHPAARVEIDWSDYSDEIGSVSHLR
jgi:hypothetical protein